MSNLPPGAEHDVHAPYNQETTEEEKASAYSYSEVVEMLIFIGEDELMNDPDLGPEDLIQKYEDHLDKLRWNKKFIENF